jgi:hypothetical protein
MRLSVTTKALVLLDKEDDIVRIAIDDADIRFGVLDLPAGEEPQLLASANGSRTMYVSEGVKERHSKIIDCRLLWLGGHHREIELGEEVVGRLVNCIVGGGGRENLQVNRRRG